MQNPKFNFKNFDSEKQKMNLLRNQLFIYESEILDCLQFNTSRILAIDFLNYFIIDANIQQNSKMFHYCFYLLNIAYMSPQLQSISKSLLAFSIVYFVTKIFGQSSEWPVQNEIKFDSISKSVLNLKIKDKMTPIWIHQSQFKNPCGDRIGDSFIHSHIAGNNNNVSLNNTQTEENEIQFDFCQVKSISMDIYLGKIFL